MNDLNCLRATLTGVRDEYPSVATAQAINSWLCNRHESTGGLDEEITFDAGFDPWGRPYVFVERDSSSHDTWDRVHVYSLGEDGKTDSDGNDIDDLNTWNEMSRRYYVRRDHWTDGTRFLVRLGYVFPAIFVASLLFVRLYKSA